MKRRHWYNHSTGRRLLTLFLSALANTFGSETRSGTCTSSKYSRFNCNQPAKGDRETSEREIRKKAKNDIGYLE